jgi:Aldehyde dehydrogenase family
MMRRWPGSRRSAPSRPCRFTTLDEALTRANAVEYGLSAAIFTGSLAAARRLTDAARPQVVGRGGPHEQGRTALDFYTESVTVYEDA